MTSSLVPMSPGRLYQFLVAPHIEGAKRLNRAWKGYNLHSLNREPLFWIDQRADQTKTLGQRSIALIIGIVLTFLPLISTIVWIAWNTFGRPEVLADPFYYETSSPRKMSALHSSTI